MSQKRKEIKKDFTVVGQQAQPAAQAVEQKPKNLDIPISFDAWWIQVQNKYKFSPNLRDAVRKHFEARGFMDYKKFNDGLRDFGFRT
jgi:hypothetical protein